MKRILLATTAAAFGLSAGAAGAQDTLTFALVPKDMGNPFFVLAQDGCEKAGEELAHVECLYIGPAGHNEEEQVQIVRDLITRGVDGIAVAPSNAPAMARALQGARDAGIPVITWDSDLLAEDSDLRASYVGTKNYDIGVNLAELLMGYKPDGGTICIQSGGAAAANHNERMQGIRDTLSGETSEEPPGVRLEDTNGWTEVEGCPLYTNDDFPLAVQQMADIFAKFPDLDAFVPTGGFPQFVDNAYRQVAEANQERISPDGTVVVVADTLPMQMEQLGDGLSLGQVGQRPYEMGYRAMFILKDLVDGNEVEDPIYTGLDVCTPDNADSCLVQ